MTGRKASETDAKLKQKNLKTRKKGINECFVPLIIYTARQHEFAAMSAINILSPVSAIIISTDVNNCVRFKHYKPSHT